MADELPPDRYWGGYTEHGELLHLAVASRGGYARSACGLWLVGGAMFVPSTLWGARCRKCVAADNRSDEP